ncbi:MAG: terminase large subunit [Sulfuricaulis sp.]|nr:terminase large subunit [Sulfuricaulis sp.]
MGQLSVDETAARASHVQLALHYAQDIVAGRIVAGKWVKAACRRQQDDLDREKNDPDWPYFYDEDAAERVCVFISLLRHVKGKWAGQRIVLEPWQCFALCCVFGWKRKDDQLRRFRSCYEEIARKNSKSTKLAGIGLYMLVADGEFGAEIYSVATTRDQAHVVFDVAQQMARIDGEFRGRFGVEALTRSLIVRDSASKFLPLAAEGSTLDGLNSSCVLDDELHAHKTRHVHDVMDSSMGARAQPLHCKITTAGSNRAGVCYDQRIYLTKILNAVLKRHDGMGYKVDGDATDDETFWGIIYTIDEGDDPLDEAIWPKANPNYGISVDPEDMRRAAAMAKVQSAALNEFLTKRLNVWVNADAAWMNMLAWDACADRALKEEDFRGEPCVIGLDAAFKKDLFAKMKVFRRGDDYYAFGRYYMPQALLDRRGWEQIAAWAREGYIRTTPGEVLDIEAVREELIGSEAARKRAVADHRLQGDIEGDMTRFEVTEIAFDPAQLTQFSGEMIEDGALMVEMRPNVLNFSPAMKELDELVAGKRFHHNGDPVLAWAISNVVCHWDKKDNIYPNKESVDQKIDPAIALIMALARLLSCPTMEKSFWEQSA